MMMYSADSGLLIAIRGLNVMKYVDLWEISLHGVGWLPTGYDRYGSMIDEDLCS